MKQISAADRWTVGQDIYLNDGARPSVNSNSLQSMLQARTARVAVVGLGYAGLPMAVELASAGFSTVGFDVDEIRVRQLAAGRSPVSNVSDDDLIPVHESGRLVVTTDPSVLDCADVAIICVPTPLTQDGGPDLGFVLSAGATLGAHLRPDVLVVLQSTCGPGTTRTQLGPVLELTSGLRAGEDFFLVFAPERIDPGNLQFTVNNTPKLVGGLTPESTRLGCLLFESFIQEVVPVGSPEIAELAKLIENTFRFINISFINEMALLCDRLGVNVWEVIEAAKTKPFAFMPHYPSPGVGGHCIPVVPQYLDAAARELGLASQLIPAANRINATMPRLVVDKLEAALAARGELLRNASVLAVGVTYKPDIADIRESASIRVLQEAVRRGARVAYHDPLIPTLKLGDETLASVTLDPDELGSMNAVLLLTPHSSIDFDRIVGAAPLVIDTHSGLTPREGPNIVNIWLSDSSDGGLIPDS